MAIIKRGVAVLDGSTPGFDNERTVLGVQVGVAFGTGTNVSVAVSWPETLPANYAVFVTVTSGTGQSGATQVNTKTATGFNVVIEGTVTVAGTFDVMVVAA